MRLVHLSLPEDGDDVLAALDDEGVDYVVLPGDDETVVQFPLPAQAVDPILDALRDAGLDDDYVVVTDAVSVTAEHFEDLEERYVTDSDASVAIQPEELTAKARDMTPRTVVYHVMTLLSGVVALAGLLLDSSVVLVGAMVIAPQVGSALTAATGAVVTDWEMLRDGLRAQVLGLTVAAAGVAAAGAALRSLGLLPDSLEVLTIVEMSQRISPGFLPILVGLAAGAAGALSLATALPVSLVGVMVAAALVPAAAAVGIGIAWSHPVVALSAGLVLASNVAAINVVAPVVLWVYGDRPSDWGEASRGEYARVAVVAVLLVAAFAGSVALSADQAAFEDDAKRATTDVLDTDAYDELQIHDVRATSPLIREEYGVTVVLERPGGDAYDGLDGRLRERVADQTGYEVPVTVVFVDQDRTRP